MNEIARKKAETLQDNKQWTASDAIEEATLRIGGIDSKKIHMFIAWQEDQPDGTIKIRWNAANLSRPDQIALIELLKFDLCKEWFGYGS